MSNILLAGKDLPDIFDFAETLAASERKVFTVCKTEAEAQNFESQNIFSSTWNKGSSISAHSLLINAENKLEKLDEAIFYFDSLYFGSHFNSDKIEDFAPAVDSMLNSFLYCTSELLRRTDQKQENLTVMFLLKESLSKYESYSQKSSATAPVSTIVTIAESAFERLAENFSVYVSDRKYLSVILAKNQIGNEFYSSEKETANWAISAFDSVRTMKNHQTVKQAGTWNKVGSKIQTGFSLFK